MSSADVEKLLDLLPVHIYWKDKDGKYLGCNLMQAQSFGCESSAETRGKTDFDLAPNREMAKTWMQHDQEVMQSGTPKVIEELGMMNKHDIIGLSYKSPIKDQKGNVTGIVGISIDITDRKKLQDQLMKEKAEAKIALDNIIAHLPGHVYWLDENNRYLGCNDLHAKSAGLENRHEIVGKTNFDLAWSNQAAFLNAINDKVRTTKTEHAEEESALMSTGEMRTFLSRKTPLLDEEGKVVGVLGISFDISDRKKAEKELLIEKEKAEAANRAKSDFLANISHDIKTPLTGVVTMADAMAHDSELREVDREKMRIIVSAGQKAVALFDGCLELAKMERDEWTSKTEVFSLRQVINDLHALFLPKTMATHLALQLHYDDTLPASVEGYKESLYRVLVNLLDNAIKFTKQGGIILRAKHGKQSNDGHVQVIFDVEDSGIGIPQDKHQVIFEKLSRLTPSYTSKIEGIGLGLYIVDQYVKRMGGNIEVHSEVGQGSRFTITLTFQTVLEKNASQIADEKPISPPQNNALTSNPRHILLVEDIEMVQFVTKLLLTNAGFSVDTASSGEEALEMFSPEKYGLIYMDIGLPAMNGYETTYAIREKEKALQATRTVPIVALTGHGALDVSSACSDAGMQGVLSKPLSREQAMQVWERYGEHKKVEVTGLLVL